MFLQREAGFFGAMDGASRFVRGDAVAGLLITLINVIAGMIIGMIQNDMSFTNAADTFTRLTVGDGLVSQIPALIVSVASALMVSEGACPKAPTKLCSGSLVSTPRRWA
ncbi:MAG: flagellar biosynthesis protein FlhA [Rhodospirillaceae bacterium]|nr:MAG: flagellar biosynthesis protein FlhA [Rhodospirillaceae bacterium]